MRKRKNKANLCLIALALPSALICQTASPLPAELIARAIAADKAQTERAWKYTLREDVEESQLDDKGNASKPTTKTYDHIMLEGEDYKKLILVDGKPPDPKTQKKVDEELEKTRAKRRKHHLLSTTRSVSMGGLDLLGRLFDNKVTGEETVLGRKAWRMESEPKPGYKAANQQEKEALAVREVNWFDREDGAMVRENHLFIRAVNGFQPGTSFVAEYTKVGEDRLTDNLVWRPDIKWMPGIHGRAQVRQRYYDYKRFTVDSTLTPQ